MKIKGYKLFLESTTQTEESVREICQKYGIENWSINSEGLVDVDGSVFFYYKGLIKLPIRFGKVSGDFECSNNQLITLEGVPKEVGGYFSCSSNRLTSLEGGPKEVGGSFKCHLNELTSLEGCPEKVGGDFYCNNNKLTSLKGGPQIVLGIYYAQHNKINSFEGFPDDFEGDFYFNNNPVQEILDQFPINLMVKAIHLINDYDAIWNGEVIPERLEMVKEKLGITDENN